MPWMVMTFLFWSGGSLAAPSVLINEVLPMPAFHAERHEELAWMELFNPGPSDVPLFGMRIVVNGIEHRYTHQGMLPARGRILWHFGADDGATPDHLPLHPPACAGTLLLLASNGTTILDTFSWDAPPPGTSIARMPDGASSTAYDPLPSPGRPNPHRPVFTRINAPPELLEIRLPDGQCRISTIPTNASDLIRCTTNGSKPTQQNGAAVQGPLDLPPSTALRCRTFSSDGLPGRDAALTVPEHPHAGPVAWLMADATSLWDDSTGILSSGFFDNHTRTGRHWERPALLGLDDMESIPVGLRIAGSGSRSLAKRSFKLIAREGHGSARKGLPFPDGTWFAEGTLRADASPHAFLRNLLLEEIVQRHDLALDIQPSTPMPLYINGRYWGLYRWMPAKDKAWVRSLSGAPAIDMVAGPAFAPRSGNGQHFAGAMEALLQGAPIDSLERMWDLNSLMDLACIDLWTGRADHDLNVRCHRPRTPDGRWRWVLFDMDLWSTAQENSVERLCHTDRSEAPFLRTILADPVLEERLLARLTVLLATALHEDHAGPLADSLYARHELELIRDHRRWTAELGNPHPKESLRSMHHFIRERRAHLQRYLAAWTGRKQRRLVIEAPAASMGSVWLEGMRLSPGRHIIASFDGVPLKLRVEPAIGVELMGWKGAGKDRPAMLMDAGRSRHLQPILKRRSGTSTPRSPIRLRPSPTGR